MAQALLTIAIHHYIRNPSLNRNLKLVAQRAIVKRPLFKLFPSEFCCFTESNDAGYVFSAGTSLTLLVSTNVLPVKSDTAPHVKRSDTFRRIQFVSRHREQIATQILDIQPQSACSLHSISMKREMLLTATSSFANERRLSKMVPTESRLTRGPRGPSPKVALTAPRAISRILL